MAILSQRIMRPYINTRTNNEQLDPRCSVQRLQTYHRGTAQSATLSLHSVARKLLPMSRPAEGRRLSWPEHTCSRLLSNDARWVSKPNLSVWTVCHCVAFQQYGDETFKSQMLPNVVVTPLTKWSVTILHAAMGWCQKCYTSKCAVLKRLGILKTNAVVSTDQNDKLLAQ